MNSRWKYCHVALVLLLCALVLAACGPPKASTEIPITTASDEARSLFLQGRDKLENIETVAAAKLLDQAIAKDSNFALAYIWRARAGGGSAVAQYNREKANALLGKVSPGERLVIRHAEAAANGQTAPQKMYLDSLLAMFPMDKRVKLMTGAYYRGLLDYKNSVKYYEEAIKLDSTYAPVYNLLGYDQVELGNTGAAEKAFKTYIQLLPHSPNPLDSYAEFLRMQGRYDESVTQYKQAMEVDPTFYSSLVGLGDCYLFKGDVAKAREYYQEHVAKALQINDKLNGLFFNAVSFVHEGNVPGALKALDEFGAFARKEQQYSQAVYALAAQGDVLWSFGKGSESLKKLDEAIQLAKVAPLRAPTRENLLFWSNYWLACGSGEAKRMDKAQDYLSVFAKDVARRGNTDEKDALTTGQGYLALLMGKSDEALTKLTAVPPDPTSLYLQGLAYEKKGDKANAKKVAEKIMQWKTNSLELAIARNKAKAWL